MSYYDELPVYKASYDLLLAIFHFTKDFAREYKYTVGEKLKNTTIEMVVLIYRANSRNDKAGVLQEAREQIEIIRLLIRLMKDLQQISMKRFVNINKHIENVSKQITGWQKKHSISE
ncbi:MAG: four helix bundle protein [FCB group bacterium]|nr:four helix bundle protein [FCB group bacterium]